MHSNFMEFNFGKLHYRQSLAGKKNTILFLHSFNSSAASFSKMSDLLKDSCNIICLDFPGHGLSEHIDVNKYSQYCGFGGVATILIEFIERLQLKNIFIVGNSLGGNAAVRAIPSLKTVDGLILIGSIQAENKEKAFEIMYPAAPLDLLFKMELNEQEVDVLTGTYVYKFAEGKDNFRQMKNDIKKTDGNFREQFARNMEKEQWVDEQQIITNITIPLLYILGLQDGFINSIYYKKLLLEAGLQESQIKLLEQVSHIAHLDNPQLCARMILEFIEGNQKI